MFGSSANSHVCFTICYLLVFFLLALYTKQTLFAAPIGAFFALAIRDKRAAFIFAICLGASGGALYLLLDFFTHGGFTFGLLESNATVFLFEQLIALCLDFLYTFPVLLALAVWSFIARVRVGRFGILECYAVTAFAALAMAGRTGAWENYFFEAIAIACVLAFTHPEFEIPNSKFQIPNLGSRILNFELRITNYLLPLGLLLQIALLWQDPRIAANLIAQDFPANQQLATVLRQTPGIVISEDMGALVTSGKPVAYYTFQYSSLARSGKWDQSWELNGLRDGNFPLVILERGTREDVDHYRRFTREFVSMLDRYYARTQSIGKYEVYTPAPGLRLQSANFGDEIALVGWSTPSETLNSGTLDVDDGLASATDAEPAVHGVRAS